MAKSVPRIVMAAPFVVLVATYEIARNRFVGQVPHLHDPPPSRFPATNRRLWPLQVRKGRGGGIGTGAPTLDQRRPDLVGDARGILAEPPTGVSQQEEPGTDDVVLAHQV